MPNTSLVGRNDSSLTPICHSGPYHNYWLLATPPDHLLCRCCACKQLLFPGCGHMHVTGWLFDCQSGCIWTEILW